MAAIINKALFKIFLLSPTIGLGASAGLSIGSIMIVSSITYIFLGIIDNG